MSLILMNSSIKNILTELDSLENKRLSEISDSKPLIGYICLRTPVELIEAMGAIPIRIGPTPGFNVYDYGNIRPDGCSFCRMLPSFLKTEKYKNLSAIIGGACCDQMRRAMDTLKRDMDVPVILYTAPRTFGQDNRFFLSEMRFSFIKLAELLNLEINIKTLKQQIDIRNLLRKRVNKLRESGLLQDSLLHRISASVLAAETFLVLLDSIKSKKVEVDSPKIMLAGSIPGTWELAEIEETGADVVADVTCMGDRVFNNMIRLEGDSFENLYDAYVEKNLCPHRRPITNLLDYIHDLALERKVDGIIYLTLKFCHPWGLSAERMRKTLKGIPFMKLDDDLTSPALSNFRTRVGAFIEMLKANKTKQRKRAGIAV